MSRSTSSIQHPDRSSHVLVIGAGGKVSQHTVPLLRAAGHEVCALVRNPDHVEALLEHDATVVVRDITTFGIEAWERLVTPFDAVVWSAGAGGGDPERTYAIDRDAAMSLIDALELFDEIGPRLVMVSYAGAASATAEEDGSSWSAYVESKREVDNRLLQSNLEVAILGPTRLTDKPAQGINVIGVDGASKGSTTSRELVAEVIVEAVGRAAPLEPNPFDFEDGNASVRDFV